MKSIFKIAFFFFSMLFLSCSKSDESENPYFQTLTYNGHVLMDGVTYPENYPMYEYAQLQDNRVFNINAQINNYNSGPQQLLFRLAFDKYGNFVSAGADDYNTSPVTSHHTFVHAVSEYFHFELEELDEINKTIRGNFSGRMYRNAYDINSPYIEVSGTFFKKYVEVSGGGNGNTSAPRVSLKLNSVDWYPTQQLYQIEYPYEGVADEIPFQLISDDRIKIVIGLKPFDAPASHNFSNINTDFFVKLAKFNPVTFQYDYYESTSGQINVTVSEITGPNAWRNSGSFSFTAVNPFDSSDVIQVTDGFFVIP